MTFEVRPSVLRRVLFGALLLLVALASQAQEEAPRFLLERITVEGPREAAGRIIKAETLLKEGATYTETELAQAVARVHRLPFVLDAQFSLRKGSTRGAYELLVEVTEARRFLFEHTVGLYTLAEPLNLDKTMGEAHSWSVTLPGLVGYRQFIGRSGVVFAALDSTEGVQVGFTRYDLFGRGIVASAGYSGLPPNFCCTSEVLPYGLDPTFVFWDWRNSARRLSAEVGVPLSAKDAIRFDWSRRDGEGSSRHEVLARFRASGSFLDLANDVDATLDRAELKWVRDTSDDPVVPSRGVTLSGGLEWSSFETGPLRHIVAVDGDLIEETMRAQRSQEIAAVVSAARHWPITPRQTVSSLGRLSFGRAYLHNLPTAEGASLDKDVDVFGGSLGLQHRVRLKQSRGHGGFGDTYLENRIELGIESTSPDLHLSQTPNPLERLELSTALVFRSVWGRLRLMVSYLDVGEVLR
ncbi:MAG TPA: hypothetical protein VEW48_22105 [Thermoanaerobaculia bacterium]|nr:hypothetical protein [Thermoanaerobaculia bacterium]